MKLKSFNLILPLTLIFVFVIFQHKGTSANEGTEVCPLCSSQGALICPPGYEVSCSEEELSIPQCIFLDKKFIPGCYKFKGYETLNLGFPDLPAKAMIKVSTDSKVYTLNREIINCKLVEN